MTSVTAWIDIGLGALIGAAYLIKLTVGQAKREMAEPEERKNAWFLLGVGLLTLAVGVTGLSWAARNTEIEWAARLASYVVVALIIVAELRSRRTRRSN